MPRNCPGLVLAMLPEFAPHSIWRERSRPHEADRGLACELQSRCLVVGRRHFWGFRRHHVIGAGTLASLIGVYSFGARLGIVPADPTALVRSVLVSGGPSIPGGQFDSVPATPSSTYPASAGY